MAGRFKRTLEDTGIPDQACSSRDRKLRPCTKAYGKFSENRSLLIRRLELPSKLIDQFLYFTFFGG